MKDQIEGDIMNPLRPLGDDYRSRVRTNTRQLAGWTGAWVATCALMAFGPKFLVEQDELQRTIMLNAMGITLGVALIVGIPYSVMSSYDMIPFKADVAHLLMLMGLTYAASNLYGQRRYR